MASAAATSMKKNHYIQNLRGYAAILVVIDHALLSLANFGVLPKRIEYLADDLGAMGVHIFFVISGFIMMYIAFDSFGKPFAPRQFIAARIKRVVPLYYFATALALGINALAGNSPYRWTDILLSMCFLPSHAHPGSAEFLYPVLGVGWTLNYEMFFYLLFTCALLFKRRLGVPFIICSLLILIAAGSGLRLTSQHPIDASLLFEIVRYFTRDIMLYFVFGIAIGLVARSSRCPSLSIPMPALIGCGLGVAEVCLCNYLIAHQQPLWRTALTMLIAILAVGFCVVARQTGQSWLAEKLGDASYSIYLFHRFFVAAAVSIWLHWIGRFYWGEVCAGVLLGIGGGYLAYALVERRLTNLVHRKPSVRSARPEEAVASVEPA